LLAPLAAVKYHYTAGRRELNLRTDGDLERNNLVVKYDLSALLPPHCWPLIGPT